MKFLQQPIEKKLSSLLGAKVTFDRLKISPLAGKLDADGMTVAGNEPNRPLLTVRGISAHISITRALAGQLSIKSLVIEGPEIFLSRSADGSLNIPKRPPKAPATPSPEPDEDRAAWEFEAESIRIEGGRIQFQDGSYLAVAEGINGELKSQGGLMQMTGKISRFGRRDVPVEFGSVDSFGSIKGDLSNIAAAGVSLNLLFAEGFRILLETAVVSSGRALIELQGKLDINRLLSAMPPAIVLPPALSAMKFNAPAEVNTRLDFTVPVEMIFPRSSV